MTYLLAKYTVLFLLTALLGFALGYWFSRRKFVDVSESYEDLRKASARTDTEQWNQLWSRLDSMPEPKETDLSNVYERIAGVTAAISKLPRPEPVSFAPVEDRLDSLQASIRNIPAPPKPKETDLQPLMKRLDHLEGTIKAIPMPEKPAPVDLSVVTGKLGDLERSVKAIPTPEKPGPVDFSVVTGKLGDLERNIKAIPTPEKPAPVDFSGVMSKLGDLDRSVRNIPKPAPQRDIDLMPVTSKLSGLERKFSEIPRPQSVDLAPIDRRLTAIETELGKLGKRLARPAKTERAPRKAGRKEPRILSAALYGKKDNLKLISGVGPKLEKLLNKNGVYYFWQVAEWNARDINIIDERLDAFKGRIARDNWVTQAKQLRRAPEAASMPAE